MFMTIVSSAMVQVAAVAFAIFLDKGERPIFPRWAGYLSAWVAMLFAPGGFVVFFKHGPFGWNGLVSFWFVLVAFSVWMLTMTILLFRAVDAQAEAATWVATA